MGSPASQEFNATKATNPTGTITTNTSTPAFKLKTGDEIRGGFEPLLGTIAVIGTLDGGTATLEIKVGGAWHSTGYTLSAAVTAILLGPETAPRASAYRFTVAGGGASIAAAFYVASRSPLVFV